MCGLWGYQFPPGAPGNFTSRAIYCAMMMKAMDNRGDESYGFALRVQDGIKVIKGVGASADKVDPQLVAGFRQVMAHTRKATSGSICEANAHPFHVKHIIGMHNGGVSNDAQLNKRYNRSCDVDSEHIFHHIAKNLPLTDVLGMGAITYQDEAKPDEVYVARTLAGSLEVYGLVEPGGTAESTTLAMVWASTDYEMKKVFQMVGYTAWPYTIKPDRLYKVVNATLQDIGEFHLGSVQNPGQANLNSWQAEQPQGVKGTDWDERVHPELETLEYCLLDGSGIVSSWVLSKPTVAYLARKRKRKDGGNGHGEDAADTRDIVATLTRRCGSCGHWTGPDGLNYNMILREYLCTTCKTAYAEDGMWNTGES